MKAIVSTSTRQPIIPAKGSGLNANNQPKVVAKTIVNLEARKR